MRCLALPRPSGRGPIDARGLRPCRRAGTAFRGHPVAAPLTQVIFGEGAPAAPAAFRGHPVAAPLTLHGTPRLCLSRRAFRGHPVAAPLTHHVALPALFLECRAFRGHPVAAPLTQDGRVLRVPRHGLLPRPSGRGPIDALLIEQNPGYCRAAFRGHPVAAPLTRRRAAPDRLGITAFRGHPVAAPLTPARAHPRPDEVPRPFRGHPVAAPLTHGLVNPNQHDLYLPRPSGRGPIDASGPRGGP